MLVFIHPLSMYMSMFICLCIVAPGRTHKFPPHPIIHCTPRPAAARLICSLRCRGLVRPSLHFTLALSCVPVHGDACGPSSWHGYVCVPRACDVPLTSASSHCLKVKVFCTPSSFLLLGILHVCWSSSNFF